METHLTQEQIAFYQENGFVAHRNLLSAQEVAELKEAVLATLSQMAEMAQRLGEEPRVADSDAYVQSKNPDPEQEYYYRTFTQRLNLWRINPVVRGYMFDSGLSNMLCQLEGAEGVPDGFRISQDQALIKEPYANPTPWHLDVPYWSFSSRHAISIWIALEDATYENGCMWFIPGSHKYATYEKNSSFSRSMDELLKFYPQMTEVDPIGVPMRAGDCSFHNGLTGHAAGANMTRQRRIAMTAQYMPVGCTFNGQRNILPKTYFDSLKIGDVLANDDWNPVVPSAYQLLAK